MVKLQQALILDPPTELHFQAPFNDGTAYLKLSNPTDQTICFKLKTTAPRTYCVRPNSGAIKPKEVTRVSVMLQTAAFDISDVSKHKFMVQAVFVPEGEVNLDSLWRDTPPEMMMNSKLRCVFEDNASEPVKSPDNKSSEETEKEAEFLMESAVSPSAKNPNADLSRNLEDDAKDYLQTAIAQLKEENSRLKKENLTFRVRANAAISAESKPSLSESASAKKQVSGVDEQSFALHLIKHIYIVCFIVLVIGICLGHFIL